MASNARFQYKTKSPIEVTITQRRWDVCIDILERDGRMVTYIASADSFYTEHDGIWLGTPAQWSGHD